MDGVRDLQIAVTPDDADLAKAEPEQRRPRPGPPGRRRDRTGAPSTRRARTAPSRSAAASPR
ncbi:hypothetical protein ACFQVA_09145 [Actinomadura keratinilytica]